MSEDSGVLDKRRSAAGSGEGRRLFSLVEVAQETGIPMPILLRYKREHPDRVPSEGSGSQQRFPESAFHALREIQREEAETRDLPRRGGFGLLSLPRLRRQVRPSDKEMEEEMEEVEEVTADQAEPAAEPAKAEAAPAAKAPPPEREKPRRRASAPAERTPAAGAGMLSLVEISERLDIPYPTLARYASQYGDRIPHQGKGRGRRFPPEAIDVFQQIRKESRPGRPPKIKKQQIVRPLAPVKPVQAQERPPAPKPAMAKPEAQPAAAGRPAAGDEGQLARRIASLEESQRVLEEQIRELIAALSRPTTVTIQQV
jgi:DNA-binding transcriptional MerR regulator